MTRAEHPEFVVLGAGAIGSVLAAHLARAGHSVVVLARGRRAQHVERHGLTIKGLVDFNVRVPVLTDPAQLQGAGVLIVAMKTTGTAAALEPLERARIDAAFSIQNGIWKNDQLVASFGEDRVLGSLANTSGELQASGDVLFTRNVNIYVGELRGGLSERAQRIASALDAAGVRSTAVPDMVPREWTKFVGWTGLMTMSVITRLATWRYLSDRDCALLLLRVVREMADLAKASGIALTDQHALLPIKTIIERPEAEALDAILKSGADFKRDAPEHRMSALQDVLAGRPLEIDETVGDAVRRARKLGLSLPTLETLYRLTAAIDRAARDDS